MRIRMQFKKELRKVFLMKPLPLVTHTSLIQTQQTQMVIIKHGVELLSIMLNISRQLTKEKLLSNFTKKLSKLVSLALKMLTL
jgi:hypothetical protein